MALLLFALLSLPAAGQFSTELSYVFSPPNPRPGDNVTVFIRSTDPVNGFVLCYPLSNFITAVHLEGTSIVLDLVPALPPGGFTQQPYCDGNTVSLGVLQAGLYTVTARPVHPSGTAFPAVLTGLLAVGQIPVPVFSPAALALLAVLVMLSGLWLRRNLEI